MKPAPSIAGRALPEQQVNQKTWRFSSAEVLLRDKDTGIYVSGDLQKEKGRDLSRPDLLICGT
jgi:hypothetical protein